MSFAGFFFVFKKKRTQKNFTFPSGFLCNFLLLRERQKKPFVSPTFLHAPFLENEEKTSGKKYTGMFSYQIEAHIPKN